MANNTKSRKFLMQTKVSQIKKQISVIHPLGEDEKELVPNYDKLDSFHKAIGPVLTIAQCFAVMPVCGVRHADPNLLSFRFKSFRMLFTIAFIVASALNWLVFTNRLLIIGITAKNIGTLGSFGIVFFSCGIISCLMFWKLAHKWPKLMRDLIKIEMTFLHPPYRTPKWKLQSRIRIAAVIILTLSISMFLFSMANFTTYLVFKILGEFYREVYLTMFFHIILVEHGMYLMSATHNFHMTAKLCNVTYEESWKGYFEETFPHIFLIVPYNILWTMPVLYLNIAFTFIWNYMDLFIIMISLGIAIRFEQINTRICALRGKNAKEPIWLEIRLHYIRVCDLLDVVDNTISPITLLSCANNLYFICYQLLNIFNKLRWSLDYLYFWFSLLYLIGRTVGIFLCAATINDESKKPLVELRSIPTKNWCIEAERFIEEVATQCVALSGMNFFYMTRKLLFGMAGTIVTYELVLLQFDEPNRIRGLPPLCG